MTIGERIKELRSSFGFSQVDFADKIDVSKQTLYKYENNIITNIPSDKIESIAHICNVSPAYVMGWSNKIEKNPSPVNNNDKVIIDKYHQLNEEGKQRLLERADELIELGYIAKGDARKEA